MSEFRWGGSAEGRMGLGGFDARTISSCSLAVRHLLKVCQALQ